MKLRGFGHINIVVDDLKKATLFYEKSLGVVPIQEAPHFKNIGFAKAAGFLSHPDEVEVSIKFLALPFHPPVFLELMQYHSPQGDGPIRYAKTNDVGGPRHICLRVENVAEAFEHLKTCDGVQMINQSPDYRPYKLDNVTTRQVRFFDPQVEENATEKEKLCRMAGNLKFFYFIDPYGVQWEIEESPEA